MATSAMVALPAALALAAAPAAAHPAPEAPPPAPPEDKPMTIDATALLGSLLGTLGVPLRLPLPPLPLTLPLPLPVSGLGPTDPPLDTPTTEPSPPAPPIDPAAPAAPAGTSNPNGTRVNVRVSQPPAADAPAVAAAAEPPRGLLREVRRNAGPFSVPLVVGLIVVAFLAVQGRLDRRDPRLVAAPVSADEGMLAFDG